MSDPEVWFPVNAQLAGLDPWSASPLDQLKYQVFQRRMSVDAAALRAQLVAAADPSKAFEALTEYLDIAIPEAKGVQEAREASKEMLLEEIANMKPIPLSSITMGTAIESAPPAPSAPRTTFEPPKTFGLGRPG